MSVQPASTDPERTDIWRTAVVANGTSNGVCAGQRGVTRAGATVCKPSAQPTLVRTQHLPTTCENGPPTAETRPGGPFSSRHAVYHDVAPRVDMRQWSRTYGGQRFGGTSGAQ